MTTRLVVASLSFLIASASLAQSATTRIIPPTVSEQACPVEVITISSPDGNKVVAAMRKPPGKGPFPALVYLHGGLDSKTLERLKDETLRAPNLRRFLAAGYVVVNPTFRPRREDPQTLDAFKDCLAIVEHVKKMPEVDSKSVVLWGDSGGGSLVLELAGATALSAIAAQEPATVLFTGIFNKQNTNLQGVMADPQKYLTPELMKFTRDKIAKINCPIFIAHGDVHAINKINNEVVIPELKQAGKKMETLLYPGERHGFSNGGGRPQAAKKFFDDSHAFFLKYLPTKPKPLPDT